MADGRENYERHGVYKGPLPMLKGERAHLICYPATGRCLAQFENIATGYGVGRHDFNLESFDVEEPTDGE